MSDLPSQLTDFMPPLPTFEATRRRVLFAPPRWSLIALTRVTDTAFVTCMTILALAHFHPNFFEHPFADLFSAILLSAILKYSFFNGSLYEADALMHAGKSLAKLAARWAVTTLALALVVNLITPVGRHEATWFLGFYLAGAVGLAFHRAVIESLFRSCIAQGHGAQNIAILGANPLSEQLVSHFQGNPHGIKFVGVFDDRNRDNIDHVGGVPKLGGLAELIDYARDKRVDFVVITLPITATERIALVRQRFKQLPLNVRILAGPVGFEPAAGGRGNRLDLPGVQLISLQNRPISEPALLVKSGIDRLCAAIGLALVAPLLLVCAIGIKRASPGPVFFRQKRIGYKGRVFDIIKLRTMHVPTQQNTVLTQRNDPRVFAFGSLLRKLSIDELPQLYNVLRGDMSLIGPRPHMPEARAAGELYFEAVREYADRHRVVPGITGWAQVNGWRGPTDTREQLAGRVEYDLYYIENWSLALDFKIFVKTLLVGFFGRNAF